MSKRSKADTRLLGDVRWSWAEATNQPKLADYKSALMVAHAGSLWDQICDYSSSELRESLYDAYIGGSTAANYTEAQEWLIETINDADARDIKDKGGYVKYGVWVITTERN